MIDLTQFRYAIKSHTVHNTVSKTQAANRAGVCFKTWNQWEEGERQPVNLDKIMLAIVMNEEAPAPKYTGAYKEDPEKVSKRAREWRERNREAHREYMREYMRRKRKEGQ